MVVSQILIMYITNLNIMAYNIMNIKTWHARDQQYEKHVNINEELEIVTKTMRVHLYVSKPW